MKESHNQQGKGKGKHNLPQVRITLRNSIDVNEVPSSVPQTYLSASEIKTKEQEGRTIIFVVKKTEKYSADASLSIDIQPLRDTTKKKFLVIVCC